MNFKWVILVISITLNLANGVPREYDLKEVLSALKNLSPNENVEITVDQATIQSYGNNNMTPRSDSTVYYSSQSTYNKNGEGIQPSRAEEYGGSTSYAEGSSQPSDTWDYNRTPPSMSPKNWHNPPPPPPPPPHGGHRPPPPPPEWDHHRPPPPPHWDHHPPPPPPPPRWDHHPPPPPWDHHPPPPPWDHHPPPPPWEHYPPPEHERSNDYSYWSTERGRRDDYGPPHHGPPHRGPPGHGPPDRGPPGHGPPGHGPPGHGPPGHGPPGHGPPGHGPPGHGPPGHGPPGRGPPGRGPPGRGPPEYGPPDHRPPNHGPPDYGPPDHRPSGYDPPGHGPPGQGRPDRPPPDHRPPHRGQDGPPPMRPPPPQEPQRPSPQYDYPNQQNQNTQRPGSSEWDSPSLPNKQPESTTPVQYDIDVRKMEPSHPVKQTTLNDKQLQDTLKQIFGAQKDNTVDFSVAKPVREADDVVPLSLKQGESHQEITPHKTPHFYQLQPVTPEE